MAINLSNLSFSRQILPVIAVIGIIAAVFYIVSDLPDREVAEPQQQPAKATGDLANAPRVARCARRSSRSRSPQPPIGAVKVSNNFPGRRRGSAME